MADRLDTDVEFFDDEHRRLGALLADEYEQGEWVQVRGLRLLRLPYERSLYGVFYEREQVGIWDPTLKDSADDIHIVLVRYRERASRGELPRWEADQREDLDESRSPTDDDDGTGRGYA